MNILHILILYFARNIYTIVILHEILMKHVQTATSICLK